MLPPNRDDYTLTSDPVARLAVAVLSVCGLGVLSTLATWIGAQL